MKEKPLKIGTFSGLSPHFKFHGDVTFSQRVQRVDHQLEDGAPQRRVVEGGRAAASLQHGTHLQGHQTRTQKSNSSSNFQVTSVNLKILRYENDICHENDI